MTGVTKTAENRMADELKFIQDGEGQRTATATSSNSTTSVTASEEPVVSALAGAVNVPRTDQLAVESIGQSQVDNERSLEAIPPGNAEDGGQPASIFDVDKEDNEYVCGVKHLCRSVGNKSLDVMICINCDAVCHLFCTENWNMQTPVNFEYIVILKDVNRDAKAH